MPPKFLNVVDSKETEPLEAAVSISFDANELHLFSFLRDVVQAFEESKIGASLHRKTNFEEPLVVRIAGGWVRDKLLNIYSDDIDIAVNHFTGVQFAQLLQEYKEVSEDEITMSSMGIVAANPMQSKHLETVCMKIAEIDVDICHLRSQEVYTEHSRIPEVEFGSPQDDAERRDFTINSLFYNIHTNQIEDWTGRGWDDIQNGLIVTPLDPRTTFLDDPLRVLRAIRFAVRYGYSLTCQSTIQQPEVRKAFATKVSRERVGKELEGMLSGKKANPVNAIMAIHELHLSSLVFMIPPECTPLTDDEWNLGLAYTRRMPDLVKGLPDDSKVDMRLLPLLSYLLPLHNRAYTVKNKERPIIEHIIKESLKLKSKDAQLAVATYSAIGRIVTVLEDQEYQRREMGLILRDVKEMWGTALILAALLRNDDRYVEGYTKMMALDGCWDVKPLLDGKALIKELGIPKGPEVGNAMQSQVEWMLENPGATKEKFIEFVRQKRKRQAEEALSK